MGIFGGIEKAKPAEGGVYILPGVYDVEIVDLKAGKTRAGRNFFVAELRVLSSSNPDRPAGSIMSWMVMIDPSYLETALGNIKSFLAALLGIQPHEVDEAGVEDAVSAANPCAGLKVHATAVNIKTRGKQTDFTKVTWTPMGSKAEAAPEVATETPAA